MGKTKAVKSKIKQILNQTRAKTRLMIIEMPEEIENSPHWMVWLALMAFIGLVGSLVWEMMADNSTVQAFLPFLFS